MSIPNHKSFSEICIEQGVEYVRWQKTSEVDKIINLLYDQIVGKSSALTRTSRILALLEYCSTKTLMTTPLYPDAPAEIRLPINELTFNTSLVRQGQEQFGLCGRFHRTLTSVLNEMTYTGTNSSQAEIVEIWFNSLIDNVLDGSNINIPPRASDTSFYRINGGNIIENDGSNILTEIGDTIELVTAAVGATSNQWYVDSSPITGSRNYVSIPIEGPGVGYNEYINSAGSTNSPTFNVVTS